MFEKSEIEKKMYSELMEEVKRLNFEYKELKSGNAFRIANSLSLLIKLVKKRDFITIKKLVNRWENGVKSRKFIGQTKKVKNVRTGNYFSNERIAVYTVVFGKYDKLLEPYCHPDNIDYYIVTDQDFEDAGTVWKKIDITKFSDMLNGLSDVEKNRFFKMKPHLLFPNYKNSIYIDGNIQIISDLTEYINCVGSCGLAAHMHSSRDCVYEESKAVVFAGKESKENMDKHIKHLRNQKFPEHFGMLECNVLARKHNDVCKKLMDEWWIEFMNFSKRDQMSLPYIIYKNNISIYDVGTLGNNVNNNPSFRINSHN